MFSRLSIVNEFSSVVIFNMIGLSRPIISQGASVLKKKNIRASMAYTCNASYSGDRDQEDQSQAGQKVHKTLP
jgi:hypothetical protein